MSRRPTWGDVRRFCRRQDYRETRTDHYRYLKSLADGSVSGTMVSFGADAEVVPSRLWTAVWRQQLRLASEEQFWHGLDGSPVRYAIPSATEPPHPLPDYLLRFLKDQLRLSDEQIALLPREQAQDMLNAHYARELQEP